MFLGATKAMISAEEKSLGQPKAFWVEKVSRKEPSAELAGDGGDTPCSEEDGQEDLTENESWELGGLGANTFDVSGLNGPGGKGSTRGRGGSRRSSFLSP